jgi:hypothetical protein
VVEALQCLSEWHAAQGQEELALQYAWRQVELDPWRESGHSDRYHTNCLALDCLPIMQGVLARTSKLPSDTFSQRCCVEAKDESKGESTAMVKGTQKNEPKPVSLVGGIKDLLV